MKATHHFLNRMMSRSISKKELDVAFQIGEEIYARNSLYLFVGEKALQNSPLKPAEKEKLNGLTIVLNPKTLEMITCFRNPGFRKKIRYKY